MNGDFPIDFSGTIHGQSVRKLCCILSCPGQPLGKMDVEPMPTGTLHTVEGGIIFCFSLFFFFSCIMTHVVILHTLFPLALFLKKQKDVSEDNYYKNVDRK